MLLALHFALQSYLVVQGSQTQPAPVPAQTTPPAFTIQTVLSDLHNPWDVAFLPDGQALFTERSGTVSVIRNQKAVALLKIADVYAQGEGGLLGLAVDPDFASNHYIYTCFDSSKSLPNVAQSGLDVRVVRWQTDAGVTTLTGRTDIVAGIPANLSGRHSGCRLAFGPDGYLWIGTGDSAKAGISQSPTSLGGKILRVDRNGKAAPGNLGGAFDTRIYSYGHRNTQGIAFAPQPINGVIGFSVEHGSAIDDEVNPLVKGNFGWDPDAGYTEIGVPMTDKTKFPNAIDVVWSSGTPTQAPSGANFISGSQWKSWNGALAVAMLKAQRLKVLTFDNGAKVTKEENILTDQGRLRSVREAPDGSLYVTTDNGTNDKILRLVAQ